MLCSSLVPVLASAWRFLMQCHMWRTRCLLFIGTSHMIYWNLLKIIRVCSLKAQMDHTTWLIIYFLIQMPQIRKIRCHQGWTSGHINRLSTGKKLNSTWPIYSTFYLRSTLLSLLGCLIDLMSISTTEDQRRSEAGLLLLIYVSISVFIHYPLCSQGSQLRVAFRSSCERHGNCISVACGNQTKHKMYKEQIYITTLNVRGPQVMFIT